MFDDSSSSRSEDDSVPTLNDLVRDSSTAMQGKAVDRRSYQLSAEALEHQEKRGLSDEEAQQEFLKANQSIGMTSLKNMLSNMNDEFPVLSSAH